jgi:type III secretion protein V
MTQKLLKLLERAQKHSDVILPVLMAAILGAMIVPLPAWVLDAGIAVNLAASAALLVAAIYAKDALKVTAFPTLLLVTTLFRLSLNVSSTRLALSEGHAGQVIQAFGEFVVRGDYLVGAVIFAILTLVQFLVVAKGAERVAEVSARFTLDAMPGKQMAIDADLRAGLIDQKQARARRRDLERESQMFGAMDGAMKFVKGDVIAGLVIVLVNLLGGLAVGMVNGMELSDAASTYALIAIGDGLVSQIPSLCITIAAGLVVTRVGSEHEDSSLAAQIGAQFFGQPKALYVVAGLCLALALIPGMPHITFVVIALMLGGLGVTLSKRAEEKKAVAVSATEPAAPAKSTTTVGVSPLTLDLSPELTALATEDGGAKLHAMLGAVRDHLYGDLGIKVPGITVRTGMRGLAKGSYALCIDEVPSARGVLDPAKLVALAAQQELAFLKLELAEGKHPVTGQPVALATLDSRAALEAAQVPVRDGRELIGEHLVHTLRRQAASLLGVQDVQNLLSAFEPQAPALVKEALGKVPLALLTDVLRRLLQEEVSIRNLRGILEALVAPTTEGDAQALTEKCRQALHRYISHKYAPTGPLFAYLIDPGLEEALREQARGTAMDIERIGKLLDGVKKVATGGKAVLLTAPDVRRTLRKLCEGAYPEVAVLTYSELDVNLQIRPVGRLAA